MCPAGWSDARERLLKAPVAPRALPSAAVGTQALPARAGDDHGLRDLKGPYDLLQSKEQVGTGLTDKVQARRDHLWAWAELYLPVAVTQSYNPLIPDLGVLVNALTFLININRLCLKDKSFQRLSTQKR